MAHHLIKKEEIIEAINELPPEQLSDLSDFIEFLQFKAEREPQRLIRLGGLWKDFPPITEEDIVEARAEMWGQFGERNL